MKKLRRSLSILFVLIFSLTLVHLFTPQAQAFNFFNLFNFFAPKSTPAPTTAPTSVPTYTAPSTSTNTTPSGSQSTQNSVVTFRYTRPNFSLRVTHVSRVTYTLEYTRTAKGQDYQEGIQGGGKALKNGVYSKSIYGGTQSSRYFIPHTIKNGKLTAKLTKLDGSTSTYTAEFVINKNKFVLTSQQYQ